MRARPAVMALAAVLVTGCDPASDAGGDANEVGPCPVGVQTTPGTCDVHVVACSPPDSCPSSPDGSPDHAFASLQAAHDAMPGTFEENWVVYVHQGTYWEATVVWSRTDPDYTVEIRPADDDRPVFDGRSSPSDPTGIERFFSLEKPGPTNLTLRGLTIQHYYQRGVLIDNCADHGGCGDCDLATTGNNQVIDNLFQYIGTDEDPACGHHGYSALGISSSEYNTVAGNQFVQLENVSELQHTKSGARYDADFDLIHAVYLAHRASNNIIRDNFVDLCTGAPFKVRDACKDNRFERNYVNRSGHDHVVNAWHANGECRSHGTEFRDNVVTFPYPMYPDSKETLLPRVLQSCGGAGSPSCSPVGEFSESGNFLYRVEPESERLRAIATGNTGFGAADEIYVALEYGDRDPAKPPFSKIVSTGRSPWLSEIIHEGTSRTVTAMVGGNFDGTGNPELVTAFAEAGTTRVYRGTGGSALPGFTGATDLGLVYSDKAWEVTALAAGDLDGNGSDELFTGLVRPCCTRIYRGNGTTSLTTWDNLLPDTGEVPVALAVGNFDGTGAPELISVLDSANPGATRIVRGTGLGTGGADNLGEIDASSSRHARSLAAQDAERDGDDELQSGSLGARFTRIYRGNGSTSATTATLHDSPGTYWTIPALARRTGPSTDHLVSGFQASDGAETQIWSGDGARSSSNVAEHYASIFDGAPDPEDVPSRDCPPPEPSDCDPPEPTCP